MQLECTFQRINGKFLIFFPSNKIVKNEYKKDVSKNNFFMLILFSTLNSTFKFISFQLTVENLFYTLLNKRSLMHKYVNYTVKT